MIHRFDKKSIFSNSYPDIKEKIELLRENDISFYSVEQYYLYNKFLSFDREYALKFIQAETNGEIKNLRKKKNYQSWCEKKNKPNLLKTYDEKEAIQYIKKAVSIKFQKDEFNRRLRDTPETIFQEKTKEIDTDLETLGNILTQIKYGSLLRKQIQNYSAIKISN
jgi:predicted NAD-dependent protein-ADP-ribosyltransferase YbiA (DUF1768 family)